MVVGVFAITEVAACLRVFSDMAFASFLAISGLRGLIVLVSCWVKRHFRI